MFRNLKSTPRKRYGGRSSNDPDFDDTSKYYCRACGFTCDLNTTRRRNVKGKTPAGEWKSGITYRSSDESADYINVISGCPFCGSFDSR